MSRNRTEDSLPPIIPGNPYDRARYFPPRLRDTAMADLTLVDVLVAEAREKRGNKYGAVRTWSELCQRTFASKAEAIRGEELAMLERAGEIEELTYQPTWVLSVKPKVTYTADFSYIDKSRRLYVVEDVKGMLTRETRVKLAWLKERGLDVKLIRKGDA